MASNGFETSRNASNGNSGENDPLMSISSMFIVNDSDTELAWQEEALCIQTDPEAFFPEKGGSISYAKKICENCSVVDKCLDYALENDERFGIWGGLSERERRTYKRKAM
jgi:WhiB family redox-sensing transcriptional regulator